MTALRRWSVSPSVMAARPPSDSSSTFLAARTRLLLKINSFSSGTWAFRISSLVPSHSFLALVQEDDVVANFNHGVHVVGDDGGGDVVLVRDFVNQLVNFDAGERGRGRSWARRRTGRYSWAQWRGQCPRAFSCRREISAGILLPAFSRPTRFRQNSTRSRRSCLRHFGREHLQRKLDVLGPPSSSRTEPSPETASRFCAGFPAGCQSCCW